MEIPFIGGSYDLDNRHASVQRTVNLIPTPEEPGNERTAWVFKDAPGLESWSVAPGDDGPAIVYAPLAIGDWAGDSGDNDRPIHLREKMEFSAGVPGGYTYFTSFGAAADANAEVSRFVSDTQQYSKTYIGYVTSLSGYLPNRFDGGATLAGNPQYVFYFLAGEYATDIADMGGNTSHGFPDSAEWCGDMRLYGATPNDGKVYWTTDAIGDVSFNEGDPSQFVTKLGNLDGPVDQFEPSFKFVSTCTNYSGSTFPKAHGSYIIRMRTERISSIPLDEPGITWEEVSAVAKQLTAVEYRSGALYQNAIGPVLLEGDPDYDNDAFWDAAAAAAMLAGDMQADVSYPVEVSVIARGTVE